MSRFADDTLDFLKIVPPKETLPRLRVKPSPFRKQLQPVTKSLHKYGCLLLPLPEQLSQEIITWAQAIPNNDLGPGGRELEPHLTLKYGFTDDSPEAIQILRALLVRHGPITVQLKEVSLFKNNEDGDVLKIDVDSQELHELNAAASSLVHTEDSYPTYQPHVTIAYLKPAVAEQYLAGTFPFLGKTIMLDRAQYACADGTSVDISLSFMGGDGLRTVPPKALPTYHSKGEGEPCEQGETAAQSGCIPATGEGHKKPSKPTEEEAKESPKEKPSAIDKEKIHRHLTTYQESGFILNQQLRGHTKYGAMTEEDKEVLAVLDTLASEPIGKRGLYRGIGGPLRQEIFEKIGFDPDAMRKAQAASSQLHIALSLAKQFKLPAEALREFLTEQGIDPEADNKVKELRERSLGQVFDDKGFVSTTSSGKLANEYVEDNKEDGDRCRFSIRTPDHQTGIDVQKHLKDHPDEHTRAVAANQQEFVLPRGTSFKVISISEGPSAGWEIDLEVVDSREEGDNSKTLPPFFKQDWLKLTAEQAARLARNEAIRLGRPASEVQQVGNVVFEHVHVHTTNRGAIYQRELLRHLNAGKSEEEARRLADLAARGLKDLSYLSQSRGGDLVPPTKQRSRLGSKVVKKPRLKSVFSYLHKGEGEPCEQGETAAQSGCVPATGEGHKKPGKTKKPAKGREEAKDAVLQAVLATGFTAAQAGLLKPANVAKKAGISKEQAQELLQEIAAEAKGEKPAKTTAPTKVHGVKAPTPDDAGFADFVATTFQQPEFDEEAATALVATDAFNPSYFSHGHEWNNSLRKGGPVTETMQRVDKAIHSSTLGQDLEVTRGVSDMEFKEGQELSDAGYGSWTLYDQVAATYTTGVATSGSGQKPTIVRCVLPKGSKGLYLEKVAEEFGLDPVDVHEVVIPRNSKYRVAKVNSDVNIAGKTVNEVVLEIVQ